MRQSQSRYYVYASHASDITRHCVAERTGSVVPARRVSFIIGCIYGSQCASAKFRHCEGS